MRHRISLALLLALLLVGYAAWAYPPHRGGMGYGSASAPPTGALTGILLGNNTFIAPAADGTNVGAITVQGTNVAAATLSIIGTDAAKFRLSNTTVPSNLLVSGTQNAGTYSISIVATLPGATGSPFTQPETVIGTALTITSVSISCGGSCAFTPGQAGNIGTASATVSSGSLTGTWSLKTSFTDHAGANCGPATNLSITSAGVLSNNSSATAGTYPVCLQYTQANAGNSPYAQVVTVTGTSLPPGLFVATNGTNNGTCSISQPCTFAAAQTAMQNSSTKITYVRAGSYTPASTGGCPGLSSTNALVLGVADTGETWRYYPPDGVNSAVITGGSHSLGDNLGIGTMFCMGASNVTIQGLRLTGWKNPQIVLGGTNNIVEDNELDLMTSLDCCTINPIMISGSGHLITHNYIHDTAQESISGAGTNVTVSYNYIANSCLGFSDCGEFYTITNNTTGMRYIRNIGKDVNTTHGAFGQPWYLDLGSQNFTLIGNIAVGYMYGGIFDRGSNNNTSGQIVDMSNVGSGSTAIEYTSGPGQSGGNFVHSIAISNGSGGAGYSDNGSPTALTIGPNAYKNYAGGLMTTSGTSGTDPNPQHNPSPLFLTCPNTQGFPGVDSWSYKLDPSSPVFGSPVNYPSQAPDATIPGDRGIAWGAPGFWGPPGFTPPHTGSAPSYGPTCGGSQNSPLAAPTTAQGNYGTGCSGTCLTFDDHWTSSTLDTTSWYPGWSSCNNVSGQQCVSVPGGGGYAFPLSGGCWGQNGGCQDEANYDYPYGYATNTSPVLTHTPLARATDGSLAFSAKLYSTTVQPTASNNPLALPPYCNSVPFSTANCAFIYWTGAGITSGGVNGSANVNNTAAIIPIAGGMFQWRMKLDSGLLNGMYPAMECGAVGGSFKGLNVNANFEFGYTGGTGALHAVGISMNNTAIGSSGNVYPVNTGDDGSGVGDLRNWHVYAAEWTGSGTHQWHYYIDGAEMPTTSNNEASIPTIGWTCSLKLGVAQDQTQGGFHTLWDTGHPGPYFMWVSDAQVYKKPGT